MQLGQQSKGSVAGRVPRAGSTRIQWPESNSGRPHGIQGRSHARPHSHHNYVKYHFSHIWYLISVLLVGQDLGKTARRAECQSPDLPSLLSPRLSRTQAMHHNRARSPTRSGPFAPDWIFSVSILVLEPGSSLDPPRRRGSRLGSAEEGGAAEVRADGEMSPIPWPQRLRPPPSYRPECVSVKSLRGLEWVRPGRGRGRPVGLRP